MSRLLCKVCNYGVLKWAGSGCELEDDMVCSEIDCGHVYHGMQAYADYGKESVPLTPFTPMTPHKRRTIASYSRQAEAMKEHAKKRRERWQWEKKIGRLSLDAHEHINRQCLCFGVSFNWNFCPGIEVEFLIWTIHIEISPKIKV